MDPIEEIAHAQSIELTDEDGERVVPALAPGLTAKEIDDLQDGLGVSLPGELRALLAHTTGIDGVLESLDFTGIDLAGFEAPDIFPAGHTIAHDGFGNYWVVDLTPGERDVAPVFFACHDPPVILVQSPSIAHFLHEVFRMNVPPHASLVDDVHEDRLFNVWGKNPGVLDRATALASGDETLRSFARAVMLVGSWVVRRRSTNARRGLADFAPHRPVFSKTLVRWGYAEGVLM